MKDVSMPNEIPETFDEAFLRWFQQRSEETWRGYQTKTFDEFTLSQVGGSDWQQGTYWHSGLSEQEIATIEQHYHVQFPPDYRLFLHMLHCVDRPHVGAKYVDGKTLAPITLPAFYDWQKDTEALQAAYEWLIEGLLFDVQHNALWPQSWGEKPAMADGQETRIRELVSAAPKLIPIFGHRYLLAEPCKAGNPVLSIYQSDMIIYGMDLRHYFLVEFGDLVGLKREDVKKMYTLSSQEMQQRWKMYEAIPFWGGFLS